jgi:hypothetical protein
MSWAAERTTSRIEDVAYCMLGIFGVHMPMLYGEKENAFFRLQEEIIRTTDDDSIFAWISPHGSPTVYRGLLAQSPQEFRESHAFLHGVSSFESAKGGIRVKMVLKAMPRSPDRDMYLGLLHAQWHRTKCLALVLRRLNGSNFARVSTHRFEGWDRLHHGADEVDKCASTNHRSTEIRTDTALTTIESKTEAYNVKTIYVEHSPHIPADFQSTIFQSIRIREKPYIFTNPTYAVRMIRPLQLATRNPLAIHIPRSSTGRLHDFQVSASPSLFLACIELSSTSRSRSLESQIYPPTIYLLVAYNHETGSSGCRIFEPVKGLTIFSNTESWRLALASYTESDQGWSREARVKGDDSDYVPGSGPLDIVIRLSAGLHRELLCIDVDFDGLMISPAALAAPNIVVNICSE